MATDNNRPPIKKNALDNRKMCLFAPAPNTTDREAVLMWNVFSNNPRVTVFTGDPTDISDASSKGRISANLDAPVFFTFIEMIERVAKSKVPIELKILNKNFTWTNGQRSSEPSIVSELHVGKDDKGMVWISVEAEKRPVIRFFILPSDWHQFCFADGTPLDKGELVTMHTLGYCNLLRRLMTGILIDDYVPPTRDQDNSFNKPRVQKDAEPQVTKISGGFEDDDIPF